MIFYFLFFFKGAFESSPSLPGLGANLSLASGTRESLCSEGECGLIRGRFTGADQRLVPDGWA